MRIAAAGRAEPVIGAHSQGPVATMPGDALDRSIGADPRHLQGKEPRQFADSARPAPAALCWIRPGTLFTIPSRCL